LSGDLVNVRKSDLLKLEREIQQFEQAVNEAGKRMERAIASAHWRDSTKERFAAKFKDMKRQTDRFVSGECRTMAKHLRELAAKVDEFQNSKF
jgi:hypothetical protein